MNELTQNLAGEVNMFQLLVAQVRAGQPIHLTGNVDEVQGKLYLALVMRLRRETGLPVHVIYS